MCACSFLVFHGGSGSTKEEIKTAVESGVVKMNVDTGQFHGVPFYPFGELNQTLFSFRHSIRLHGWYPRLHGEEEGIPQDPSW